MNTRKSILPISLMAIISILFMSCGDDGDTTKPVINLIEPKEGAILLIGDERGIHFDMELSDNEMLASYRVEIHSNFDGHSHNKRNAITPEKTEDFRFDKLWDVPGLKNIHIHHHEIKIPSSATPGNYHLVVYCTDAAGNQANIARNIVLAK